MAWSRIWRFRLLLFAAHVMAIALLLWFISSISQPPSTDQKWLTLPREERFVQPEYVRGGREIYRQYCVACHGAEGQGGTAPALNDQDWLHGGSVDEVIASISDGYPLRGMAAWQPILGEAGVEQVGAYVLSLAAEKPR